jgi:hypothetical protein
MQVSSMMFLPMFADFVHLWGFENTLRFCQCREVGETSEMQLQFLCLSWIQQIFFIEFPCHEKSVNLCL